MSISKWSEFICFIRTVLTKQYIFHYHPMNLPDISCLSLNRPDIRAEWTQACGTRPDFKPWHRLRGCHKRVLLHDVANDADDDTAPDGNYVSAYEQVDIDDMFSGERQWSVEHVVPRSHIDGRGAHEAENDPIGWIEATSQANSRRSNHPLYLWRDPEDSPAQPNTLESVDGELHYVPPMEQRARLARKWLFIRATYEGVDPPTDAQKARALEIVDLVKTILPQPAEERVNEHYRKTYGWANPLLEESSEKWLNDPRWRDLVFAST